MFFYNICIKRLSAGKGARGNETDERTNADVRGLFPTLFALRCLMCVFVR